MVVHPEEAPMTDSPDMDDDEGPAGFGLVMPFVTVASKGGPHDDESYAAGYAMGMLDAHLSGGSEGFEIIVHTESIPQADLLAMRFGYVMTENTTDEWTTLSFVKVAEMGPET